MEDWFIDLIKKYEGFRPNAYWDVDHYSIGYGTDTMPDGSPVKANSVISEPEAAKLIPKYINSKINYIKKHFPNYDQLPNQVKYALIDQVYRGGAGALDKSPKYVKAVKQALEDGKITSDEMPTIIKEMEIYTPDSNGELLLGVQNRKRRRAAMLLGVYNPKHIDSVGNKEKDIYYTFDSDYNNPNTMWGQVVRTFNLPQNFVQRLWDPNRETLKEGNGIATHKLSYFTEGNHDLVVPFVQQSTVPVKKYLLFDAGRKYTSGLTDFSNNPKLALDRAVEMGDTIHVPQGMGETFTTTYKNYYPGFKDGGTLNYLDIFKSGGSIHIKKKNRGKFTKSAKEAGESVQEHAHKVMNDPNATPLQKKRANFAIQSKKWHK